MERGKAAGAAAVCKSDSLPGAEIVLAYRNCLRDSWHTEDVQYVQCLYQNGGRRHRETS